MARPAIVSQEDVAQELAKSIGQLVSLGIRKVAKYVVEIEGKRLARLQYSDLVESIMIDDTDDAAPVAMVRLVNEGGKLTDDLLFQQGQKLVISTGWSETSVRKRGNFYIARPQWRFGYGQGKDVVELLAYGEIALMAMSGEKRRSWKNITDSEIVAAIGKEYGFGIVHVSTDANFRHEKVIQANENDAQFLRRLASRNGFQLFVDDGDLHFHEVTYNLASNEIILQYRNGPEANVNRVDIGLDTFLRGRKFTATQIDPISGEVISVSSRDKPDEFSDLVDLKEVRDLKRELQTWKSLAAYNSAGDVPVEYLTNTDHEQTSALLQRQVEGLSQSTRYLVEANTESLGVEGIKSGTVIIINGVGKFSGAYYVKRSVHNIDPMRGYRMQLEVVRTSIQRAGTLASREFGASGMVSATVEAELTPAATGTVSAAGFAVIEE